jgi:hypothetical protein
MSAVSIHRALLLLRGCWLLLEWSFGWGPHPRQLICFASPVCSAFRQCSRPSLVVGHPGRPLVLSPVGAIDICFGTRGQRRLQRAWARTTTTGQRRPHLFSTSAYLLSCWMVQSLQCLFYRQCVIHLQGRPNQSIKLAPALFYGPSIIKEPGGSSLSALTAWSVFVSRRRQRK